MDIELLIDLHLDGERQGPGSVEVTQQSIALSGLRGKRDLQIADIGCGTGASTLVLAEEFEGPRITAVDLFPQFLERLEQAAERKKLRSRIATRNVSMDKLPFAQESLDAIWSEGAIYNIGFEQGVRTWRPLLKPGGVLAVSELTWLTKSRPEELERTWAEGYPEVDTAGEKLAVLERNGFKPIGYFVLPEACWLEHYYRPLQARFPEFLKRHSHSKAALALVEEHEQEIDLYERHAAYVSYGYYIAQRTTTP